MCEEERLKDDVQALGLGDSMNGDDLHWEMEPRNGSEITWEAR